MTQFIPSIWTPFTACYCLLHKCSTFCKTGKLSAFCQWLIEVLLTYLLTYLLIVWHEDLPQRNESQWSPRLLRQRNPRMHVFPNRYAFLFFSHFIFIEHNLRYSRHCYSVASKYQRLGSTLNQKCLRFYHSSFVTTLNVVWKGVVDCDNEPANSDKLYIYTSFGKSRRTFSVNLIQTPVKAYAFCWCVFVDK